MPQAPPGGITGLLPNPSEIAGLPDPSSLHPPLTAAQKTVMFAYLKSKGYTNDDILGYLSGVGDVLGQLNEAWLAHYLSTTSQDHFPVKDATVIDPIFINIYTVTRGGGGFGHAPTHTVWQAPDFLKGIGKWFVDNLARLGEIVVGVVIVGVAAAAVVKGKR